jgi:type IV fimbrial biogenesis protein FimT
MLPVSRAGRQPARGFSLLEAMVALAVMGVLLAAGMPAMSNWAQASKARSALDFYAEGFALARQQAISHNGASRIMLTPNADNGQNDWQVDICFPAPGAPCGPAGAWSTTAAPAAGDPDQANGFKSVLRRATALPKSTVFAPTLLPAGASAIYFNSVGWVDTSVGQRMTSLRFTPGFGYENDLRPGALVIGLAGTATRCDWSVALPDSRACPP